MHIVSTLGLRRIRFQVLKFRVSHWFHCHFTVFSIAWWCVLKLFQHCWVRWGLDVHRPGADSWYRAGRALWQCCKWAVKARALIPISPVLMEQGWAAHMALVGVEALWSLAHRPHSHSAVRFETGQILTRLCPLLDSLMDAFGDWTALGEAFVSSPIRRAKMWAAEWDLQLLGHVLDKFHLPGTASTKAGPFPHLQY